MEIQITDLQFNKFAIILDNVFTKEECDCLIQLSEEIPENYCIRDFLLRTQVIDTVQVMMFFVYWVSLLNCKVNGYCTWIIRINCNDSIV